MKSNLAFMMGPLLFRLAPAFVASPFAAMRQKQQHLKEGASWIDTLVPDFMRQRQVDFERLRDSDQAFGPGPLVLLYNFPRTIDESEVDDMISDAAPVAHEKGCSLRRVDDVVDSPYLDLTLQEALVALCDEKSGRGVSSTSVPADNNQATVLYFSGFSNPEMMAAYDTMGREVYLETSRTPACAKAVPNAMKKTLRQVLTEISGDHDDAIQSRAQE